MFWRMVHLGLQDNHNETIFFNLEIENSHLGLQNSHNQTVFAYGFMHIKWVLHLVLFVNCLIGMWGAPILKIVKFVLQLIIEWMSYFYFYSN